ncbi:MAG: A24 family peptidase C-terminal domain-containing protein [Thermoplasmata archaeon]
MDAFAATRLLIGTAFLLVAAVSDVRTRKVRDPLWIGLGSIGLVLLAVQLALDTWDPSAAALLGSSAILFYAIFFGAPLIEEDGFHPRPLRLALFGLAAVLFVTPAAIHAASGDSLPPGTLELYSMPVMVIVYQGFYRARLLHGGADAKALIALNLLVPTYPDLTPLPVLGPDPRLEGVLRIVFPFSLVTWVDAAVLFLAVPVVLLVVNAIRGDLAFPQALLGYRVRSNSVPRHAWLMEKIDRRGDHMLVLFPKRGGNPAADLARLRDAGIDRVWVTPQIPFMVPLLGGFLLAFLVGNILLAIPRLGA